MFEMTNGRTPTGGRGGKRAGAGKKPGTEAVAVDVRERLVIAKADKEEHLAALAGLQRAEAEGRLVDVNQGRKSAQRAGIAIRNAILSVPGRYAAQLATIDDERDIERLLTEVLREELTRLADSVAENAA
jgi:phage terminase Nu1 subunit (DNA packaging protein)